MRDRNLRTEIRPSTGISAKTGRPPTAVPAVSVVMPTYNRAHFLNAALDTVAAQTFTDYEIIVVDDGSEDETQERIAARDQPIRYLYQANQGVSEARNHALRITRSEFVAFLDSDDLWQPTFLAEAVKRLREHPEEALVYTDFASTNAAGNVIRGHRKRPRGGNVTPELFASTFIHTSAVVARSRIIRDAGGFDGRLTHNEDYDLWLRLSLRYTFGLVPEPLCLRRCHANSLSRDGCSPDILLRKAELLTQFYEQGGGKPNITETLAHHRLAKLYYTAGKSFLRAGRSHDACRIFRESLQFRPRKLKTWFWYAGARTSSALHRPPVEPAPATQSGGR